MLEELRLRGLGVIDDAVLPLGPGFTAVTGETGAGKTMLLTGLALLFGGRADPALVRAGHDRAAVEGRVRVAADHPAVLRALDAGAELDDGALILSRIVGRDGRSRAFVGGRSVPIGVLAELAGHLLAVHGQADQRGLLRPSVQRGVLDSYAGTPVAVAHRSYRQAFDALAAVRRELTELSQRRRERAQEADLLRHGLAEIAAVAPVAGEDAALRAEAARLTHAESLHAAADTAGRALASSAESADAGPDALSLVGHAAGVDRCPRARPGARHARRPARGGQLPARGRGRRPVLLRVVG
jgi:DNA repair protein RecN (Recombination protein N)